MILFAMRELYTPHSLLDMRLWRNLVFSTTLMAVSAINIGLFAIVFLITIVRTTIHSVKPENIASFLGQKLHWNYQGEMGNNFNTIILGTRVKHQMGAVFIKMYDKFGVVLRIETTVNDISQLKHLREVQHRDGSVELKMAPMKKNIYSLYPLAKLLEASNRGTWSLFQPLTITVMGRKSQTKSMKPSNGRPEL